MQHNLYYIIIFILSLIFSFTPIMQILQWNAPNLSAHCHELKALIKLNQLNPQIISIQETHFGPKTEFELPGYRVLRHDRPKTIPGPSRGGLAILIQEHLNFSKLKVNTPNLEAHAITLKHNNKNLNIFNIYHRATHPFQQEDLNVLQNSAPSHSMYLGDLNCHHK